MRTDSKLLISLSALVLFGFPTSLASQAAAHSLTLSAARFLLVAPDAIPAANLLQPEQLVSILKKNNGEKPLLIQVGSHVLYQEAHIPGSEYIGPASSAAGLERLRNRLHEVPKNKLIVLYCGCCPWSHCPNVQPAWELARSLGFTNLKVLFIANNFGTDWADKGYPVARGD